MTLVSSGYVLNSDALFFNDLFPEIISRWNKGPGANINEPLVSSETGSRYYLFSSLSGSNGNLGILVQEKEFILSDSLKILLLASFFLTVFLIVFLVFSFRQDSTLIIKDRVKQFQIEFFREYFERKDEIDWAEMA